MEAVLVTVASQGTEQTWPALFLAAMRERHGI